jgi:hypothetical protein
VKAYPKLHALIQECWRVRRKERPNFDQIVKRLQGDIGDEIKRKEEPKIELYSQEDDMVYRERIGKEDELGESDGEDAVPTTRRSQEQLIKKAVDKLQQEKAEMAAHHQMLMLELQARAEAAEEKVKELEGAGV